MKLGFLRVCFFAVAGLLAGCGTDKADNKDATILLEGYSYDCVMEMPDSLALDEDGGRYVRVTGQGMLPAKIGGEKMEQVRDSLMRLGGLAEINKAGGVPIVPEGYKLTNLGEKVQACSSRYNQLIVTLVTPRLVVWRNYAYSYLCHAAHGTYTTTYVNYSVEKKKILTLDDIFKEGYGSQLAELLRAQLKEDGVSLSVPLEEVGVPADFEITETGIRFVYPLYEIAPYVEGEVKVDIADFELDELLREGIGEMLWPASE